MKGLWEALTARPAGFLYPHESAEYQEWLIENTAVAGQFHHQMYVTPETQQRYPNQLQSPGLAPQYHSRWNPAPEWERWRNFWCVV